MNGRRESFDYNLTPLASDIIDWGPLMKEFHIRSTSATASRRTHENDLRSSMNNTAFDVPITSVISADATAVLQRNGMFAGGTVGFSSQEARTSSLLQAFFGFRTPKWISAMSFVGNDLKLAATKLSFQRNTAFECFFNLGDDLTTCSLFSAPIDHARNRFVSITPFKLLRLGIGGMVKNDLASGVNAFAGWSAEIGGNTQVAAHIDVLRRMSCSVASAGWFHGTLDAALRLRMNLITLHKTALDFGVAVPCSKHVVLRASTSSVGTTIGATISDACNMFEPWAGKEGVVGLLHEVLHKWFSSRVNVTFGLFSRYPTQETFKTKAFISLSTF